MSTAGLSPQEVTQAVSENSLYATLEAKRASGQADKVRLSSSPYWLTAWFSCRVATVAPGRLL